MPSVSRDLIGSTWTDLNSSVSRMRLVFADQPAPTVEQMGGDTEEAAKPSQRDIQMWRWLTLLALNILAHGFVLFLMIWFDPIPLAFYIALQLSLGFPLYIVIYLFKTDLHLFEALALMALNPFLWATMVEWGLRRFVDRPKDSDAGEGE